MAARVCTSQCVGRGFAEGPYIEGIVIGILVQCDELSLPTLMLMAFFCLIAAMLLLCLIANTVNLGSWTPEESKVESCEHQDSANIHCQPFPEMVSEEHNIYTDNDGCHRHDVKHDNYLSAHFGSILVLQSRLWIPLVILSQVGDRCSYVFCDASETATLLTPNMPTARLFRSKNVPR